MITTTDNDYIKDLQNKILALEVTIKEKDQLLSLCKKQDSLGKLQGLLIFIRDNVIHGSDRYVRMINSTLEGN